MLGLTWEKWMRYDLHYVLFIVFCSNFFPKWSLNVYPKDRICCMIVQWIDTTSQLCLATFWGIDSHFVFRDDFWYSVYIIYCSNVNVSTMLMVNYIILQYDTVAMKITSMHWDIFCDYMLVIFKYLSSPHDI